MTKKAYKHLDIDITNSQKIYLISYLIVKRQSYHTDFIKNKAIDLGFISCGISKSGFLNDEVNRFEKWLKNNYHGKMSYMERNFDKRMDTTKLVEGSKKCNFIAYIIIIQVQKSTMIIISKYQNMHTVKIIILLLKKLKTLLNEIRNEIGHIDGRVFVDSAPILERAWAKKVVWADREKYKFN